MQFKIISKKSDNYLKNNVFDCIIHFREKRISVFVV